MDKNTRNKEEEIIKDKIGIKDINLDSLSDEDVEKAVTKEDKVDAIKKSSGAKDLNIDNLPDDQIDSLLGKIDTEKSATLSESVDEIIDCIEAVQGTEKDILEALKVNVGLKLEEAKKIYDFRMQESTSFIEKEYKKFKENFIGEGIPKDDERERGIVEEPKPFKIEVSEEVDHIEDLKNIKGENPKKKIDLPEVEYADKKEAKTFPYPEDISPNK